MKKLIFSAAALLLAAATSVAQTASTPAAKENKPGKSEWLRTFTAVEINAPATVRFVRVPESEAAKIEYDTRGFTDSRFRFEVKDRVLHINERTDARRTERTDVTIYYNDLQSLSVSDAAVSFGDTLRVTMFDLQVREGASIKAVLDVKDLKMDLSGRSKAALSGSVRYLTLAASTGRVDALGLEVMAARVSVSTGGRVQLDVRERLEASTTTNGTLSYKQLPLLLRSGARFLGGDIAQIAPEE